MSNQTGRGMSAPPPPRWAGRTAVAGAAAADPGSHHSGIGHDQPAAGWIRVAAARDILVVDDNDRHLDILSAILTSVGHEVETCGSGADALRRLEGRHYDVVVLDLVMPDVSGIAVARHMRDCSLNCDTPIIICTANMTIARSQLTGIAGIVSVIGKPIDTASLVLAVAHAPIRERARRGDDDHPRM